MQDLKEVKSLIESAKSIHIIPTETGEEGVACALALFYTLKELKKNVNLSVKEIPERLSVLAPSLDYISHPKDFIISIPKNRADISEVGYEKNNDSFKIYLKTEKGNIKKSDVSFYFAEIKPDLIITIGIKSASEIKDLDLSHSAILNINNQKESENFGRINLIELERPLSALMFDIIKSIDEKLINKKVATSLLAALMVNQNNSPTAQTINTSTDLLNRGAEGKEILENIYKDNIK